MNFTLKDFMELVGYRITSGGDYQWQCYGSEAYALDSWDGDQDGHSATVIFDLKTQVVYEMQVHDYAKSRAYRISNPDFVAARTAECAERNLIDNAWDHVDYVNLDVFEDFQKKAAAIVAGEEYDTRVSVPLELDDHEILTLMKMAHKEDITFNQLMEKILREKLGL